MENLYPEPIHYIPVENIINSLDQNRVDLLTCPICKGLVLNYIDCAKCGRFFCKSCISESISKTRNQCPICRRTPFESTGAPSIKYFFTDVKVKCLFYTNSFEYFEYFSHLQKCKFRKYYCSNEGCKYANFLFNLKDLIFHAKQCPNRKITCTYCRNKIKAKVFDIHSINCKEKIICGLCHHSMGKYDYYFTHLVNGNNECLIYQIENNKSIIKEYKDSLLNYKIKEKNLTNSIISLKNEITILQNLNRQLLEENKILKKKND